MTDINNKIKYNFNLFRKRILRKLFNKLIVNFIF